MDYTKLPRLYVDAPLKEGTDVQLSPEHAHYLRNVLRRQPGEMLRLFNGKDGEWRAALRTIDKKAATAALQQQLLPQPAPGPEIHLLFAPIKKARMDFLIEKAVELGATHLHPVLTQNTEVRQIKQERLQAQIVEAAEQCERMDVPVLSDLTPLEEIILKWDKNFKVFACLERADETVPPQKYSGKGAAYLIGPEGGFSHHERDMLQRNDRVDIISLGNRILRSETAALAALSSTLNYYDCT